ncbi:phosphotransferase [Microbacterium oxydans]|uniref:Hydroxylysine kinase n=1 Tax=Microbacterium oxydans TaxID=82380 RepID=A0A0F0LBZ7_9MICO|nr:phosphotransferase [Microbacterium oxydans]KJL29096.1 Homoserine kinase [Microbacterium oxydans]
MDAATEALLRDTGLAGTAHRVDEDWLARVLDQRYGLQGNLSRLDTEKDATYRLRHGDADAAGEFLVKISHPEEPLDVVRCQVDVIGSIEHADPGIPLQNVRPALDGRLWRPFDDETGQPAGILRVYRFLPGLLLAEHPASPQQRHAVGAMLGRVDSALADFAHPGETPLLAWDLRRFLHFEPLIELEADERRHELARQVFGTFREEVQPRLATARSQVIHGDFSPYNVVVDPSAVGYVSGVIDFGDTMRAPVVFDPAVLLGNHLQSAPRHPWVEARDLLDGYRDMFPLSDEEVGMVAVAAAARVVLRALIATWRLEQGTDRADYVRRHALHDWGRVAGVIDLGFDAAHSYLLHQD